MPMLPPQSATSTTDLQDYDCDMSVSETTTLPVVHTTVCTQCVSAQLAGEMESDLFQQKYQLIEYLGEGSTCKVYRAQHRTLGFPVAIKVVHTRTTDAATRMLQHQVRSEAMTLTLVNHPGVVRLWDYSQDAQASYIVLEYVAGQTLAKWIERDGPMHWRDALGLGRQLACALRAIAQEHITHRDVKPVNIMVTPVGVAKLIDFGLAVVRSGRTLYRTPSSRQAAFAGTGTYMAPEQILQGGAIDFRTDMYGLGATLYHAMAGCPPFQATTVYQMLHQHLHAPVTPLHMVCPGMSLAASALVSRLLAKSPDDRFASFDELIQAMDRLLITA